MCKCKDDNDNNNDDDNDDGERWVARGRRPQMTSASASALAVGWWQRRLISNKHLPSHQPASICL